MHAMNNPTIANWRLPPFNRRTFSRVREIIPTANITGDPRIAPLPRRIRDLSRITVTAPGGVSLTMAQYLDASASDALIVLQRGKVVSEWYRSADAQTLPHIVFSVSKSLTALLAGILAEEGLLDPEAPVARYVPEVDGSAYADTTVRHLLDMTVSVAFTEDYLNPDATFLAYRAASGWNPRTASNAPTLHAFLPTLAKGAYRHGDRFSYKSPNSDLLGWVAERAAGRPFAELFSERVWRPMGAAADAYVTVDPVGAPRTAGGICTTIEDLARVGELIRCRGVANGRQIVPGTFIDDLWTGGSAEHWAKGDLLNFLERCRYRSKWYNDLDGGRLVASGIHGQWIIVDPKADLVIAKHASQPEPSGEAMDRLNFAAFDALSAALR